MHPFARIRSRVNSPEFLDNYDRIFGKKESKAEREAIDIGGKVAAIREQMDADKLALVDHIKQQLGRDVDKLLDAIAVQAIEGEPPKGAAQDGRKVKT
jgi:hypothetical protein